LVVKKRCEKEAELPKRIESSNSKKPKLMVSKTVSQSLSSPAQVCSSPPREKTDDMERNLLASLQGDRRLVISFEDFGTLGALPQRFGKSGLYIPDGLTGTHTVYQEQWRFQIAHTKDAVPKTDIICLRWSITNLTTGHTLSKTESLVEAESRSVLGWTISSKLFRDAMHQRATEHEELLRGETNLIKIANLKSLIKTLRPKTFTQGPLIFGLKHRIVQEKIGNKSLQKQ
jgi:hypothetical protein